MNCRIPECVNERVSGRTLCHKHRARAYRNGHPEALRGPHVMVGEENPMWVGDKASYTAVHMRLMAIRGKARLHACVDCGCRARQWSYDRTDDNELQGEYGPYSTDLNRYVPRCISCHKKFDLEVSA